MAKNIQLSGVADETTLPVSVTAEPGGTGAAVAYSAASTSVTVSNTSTVSALQYRINSGAWVQIGRDAGVELKIDLSANTLYLRRGGYEGGPASALLTILGLPTLDSSGVSVAGMPKFNNSGTAVSSPDGVEISETLASQLSFLSASIGSSANKATFAAAVTAGMIKYAGFGHSLINGDNQNFDGSTLYKMLKNAFTTAYPTKTFSFANYGIGGTIASNFLGTLPSTVSISARSVNVYRSFWENDTIGPNATAGQWADKVAAWGPDIVGIGFDANDGDPAAFGIAMEAIITDINSGSRWSAKRPTMFLISSYAGVDRIANGITAEAVRMNHRILRGLSKKYGIPIVDAGRVGSIYDTGSDPAGMLPFVSGELNRPWAAAALLPTTDFESVIGAAYSASGATLRTEPSAANLRTFRKRLCYDGAIQAFGQAGSASTVLSLFYRADPNDANYAVGTGRKYELRVSGTTAQAYFWTGGAAVAIAGASFTLSDAVATNSTYQMRVEFDGAEHKILVQGATGTEQSKTFFDFQYVGAGYSGLGFSVAAGFFQNGSIGNKTKGTIFEWWDRNAIGKPKYTPGYLLNTVNDWTTNYSSIGGNSNIHPTNYGHKLIYEPALYGLLRGLQAS